MAPITQSMPGKLNIFQRTMLHWNELHPYNAVHAVRLPGTPDLQRLRHAIHVTLQHHGLTGFTLDAGSATFSYHGGDAVCEIKILTHEENLAAEIAQQLNTPFAARGSFSPFRFFVAPSANSFLLGLVYFHAVADAESIIRLMHDFAAAYEKNPADEGGRLNLYPDRARRWWRPGLVAKKIFSVPSFIRNLRRSCRVPCRDANDGTNGVALFSLPPAPLRAVLAAAKDWSVTVNDVFLALLLKGLAPLVAPCRQHGRRKQISIGCIVNTRRDLGADSREQFGLFLGSFVATHAVPEGIGLRELAGAIQRQTEQIKRNQLYLAAPVELWFMRLLLPFFSTARQKKVYLKNYPLWGGVTNMKLNSLWPQSPDYFRVVATGPVTPLVLSVTTVGDHANIGLSYRTTVFSETDITGLQQNFRAAAQQLEAGA